MFELLLLATVETLEIVLIALVIGVVLGLPIASVLFLAKKVHNNYLISYPIELCVNVIRSIPYIILVIALIPVTRFIVGSSIGTLGASFPLGVASTALIVRVIYEAFIGVQKEILDLAISMRATKWQIISKFIIPESLPSVIGGMTIVIVNLICYSAMAGMAGGGGLGNLAIKYGYQRYNYSVMLQVIVILVILVNLVQFLGNYLSDKTRKN